MLVGKYTSLSDAYLSVTKALQHASLQIGRKLSLEVGDFVVVFAATLTPSTTYSPPTVCGSQQPGAEHAGGVAR